MLNRSEGKRSEILDTAAILFAERGYQGTNMRILASEAQASTSTIYSYFSDKKDLLSQSIEHRLEAIESTMLNHTRSLEDPIDGLLSGITLLNRTFANDPLLSKIMVYDTRVSDVRISSHGKRVLGRIHSHGIALVRDAVKQGVLECDDPKALIQTIRLAFQGWLVAQARGEDQLNEQRLTRTIKHLILGLVIDE